MQDIHLSLKDYIIQIILGKTYYGIFWYLATLLFLSIVFTIFSFLFKMNFLFMIQLFGFFIYEFHRSSINYVLKINSWIKYSFILIIRFTPISVLGLTIGSLDLITNLKKIMSEI